MSEKIIDKKNLIKDFELSNEYESSNKGISVPIGFDDNDYLVIEDLSKYQHILVSGVTGSGKTSFVQAIIASLIKTNTPENVKFVIADSKRVDYNFLKNSPYLFCPIINDSRDFNIAIRKIYNDINSPSNHSSIKTILSENSKFNLFVVMDDFGLFNRDIDENVVLTCLAQESRIYNIHLVFITSTPNTSVIPNEIKANISCRVAFNVASKQISKMIIDDYGAEKLKCPGELLFKYGSQIKKCSFPYIDYNELKEMIDSAIENSVTLDNFSNLAMKAFGKNKDLSILNNSPMFEDSLYKDVVEFVKAQQKASVSLIQRRFGIGYNRAAKLIDTLEEYGIIGPANGSNPREVYIKDYSNETNSYDDKAFEEKINDINNNKNEIKQSNETNINDNSPEIKLRYFRYTSVIDGSFTVHSNKVHISKKIDVGNNTATVEPVLAGNTIEGLVLKKPKLFNRTGYFCLEIKKAITANAYGSAKNYVDINNISKYTTLEFDLSNYSDVKEFIYQLSEDIGIPVKEL